MTHQNLSPGMCRKLFWATLNAHMHEAKHVLSFVLLRKCRDPSNLSRSLIISPQSMSSIPCDLHWWNMETTTWAIPRTPLWRRERKQKCNPCKPVARHFNLPNHSKEHNLWQSAASPYMYIKEAWKPQNSRTKLLFFKLALLILTVSTSIFNLLFFTLPGTNQWHSSPSFCIYM